MGTKKGSGVFLERKLIKSDAFRSLTKIGMLVYIDFLSKRKMQYVNVTSKRKEWIILNDGKIEYTYSEALGKGITKPRFARALDELVLKGLIDISYSGGGYDGDKSLYAISQRWEIYGTLEFVKKYRPKDKRQGRGFSAVNERNGRGKCPNPAIKLIKRKNK